MEYVEPIRDRKKISQIKNLLRGEGRQRDLLLFTVGINSALRVSDLLKLQIGDFMDKAGKIRSRFWIREEKRNKRHEVTINDSIKEAFQEYLVACPAISESSDHYLFFNTRTGDFTDPIKRGQAWKFVAGICDTAGLRGNYGTRTLRKTWGYHARLSGVDLALIMHTPNHKV
jgi:integrase